MLSSSRYPAASIAWSCQPANLKAFHVRQIFSKPHLSRCTSKHARSLLLPSSNAVRQGTVRQAATDASLSTAAALEPHSKHGLQQGKSSSSRVKQQTLDYTVLAACCHELAGSWVPSKVEEVRNLIQQA
jgi:hypothetical protein